MTVDTKEMFERRKEIGENEWSWFHVGCFVSSPKQPMQKNLLCIEIQEHNVFSFLVTQSDLGMSLAVL